MKRVQQSHRLQKYLIRNLNAYPLKCAYALTFWIWPYTVKILHKVVASASLISSQNLAKLAKVLTGFADAINEDCVTALWLNFFCYALTCRRSDHLKGYTLCSHVSVSHLLQQTRVDGRILSGQPRVWRMLSRWPGTQNG